MAEPTRMPVLPGSPLTCTCDPAPRTRNLSTASSWHPLWASRLSRVVVLPEAFSPMMQIARPSLATQAECMGIHPCSISSHLVTDRTICMPSSRRTSGLPEVTRRIRRCPANSRWKTSSSGLTLLALVWTSSTASVRGVDAYPSVAADLRAGARDTQVRSASKSVASPVL